MIELVIRGSLLAEATKQSLIHFYKTLINILETRYSYAAQSEPGVDCVKITFPEAIRKTKAWESFKETRLGMQLIKESEFKIDQKRKER